MDGDSQSIPSGVDFLDQTNNDLAADHFDLPATCSLCGRTLSLEADFNSNLRNVGICVDCKFVLLEVFGIPSHDSYPRRLRRRRRRRSTYRGSESNDDNFLQQFSQIINLARQIEPDHDALSQDIDPNSNFSQSGSLFTISDGSRRWRRIISDAESDGFNSDSFYDESESIVSLGASRISHVDDSDAVSFSGYGGDSDASVDGRPYFETDLFAQSMGRSDIDSDFDIDPMHVGAVQWNSDDHESVEDDNGSEVDAEGNAVASIQSGVDDDVIRGSDILIRQKRAYSPYHANSGDYLDARGFEEFLEHLADNDNSRRGAPPAAASFVDGLPLVVLSEEHQEPDGLACAICKDLLIIGTEVNQLPCLHLYHPPCILPWLSARNSCPLCRFELPTDDIDYELGKNNSSRMIISQIQQDADRDDSSSITTDASVVDDARELGYMLGNVGPAADDSRDHGRRGRWLFLVAAPIMGLMGVALVLWLGNSRTLGMRQMGLQNLSSQHPQGIHTSDLGHRNQRLRRWWWF